MRQIEAFRSPGHVELSNITGQRVTPKMNCDGKVTNSLSGMAGCDLRMTWWCVLLSSRKHFCAFALRSCQTISLKYFRTNQTQSHFQIIEGFDEFWFDIATKIYSNSNFSVCILPLTILPSAASEMLWVLWRLCIHTLHCCHPPPFVALGPLGPYEQNRYMHRAEQTYFQTGRNDYNLPFLLRIRTFQQPVLHNLTRPSMPVAVSPSKDIYSRPLSLSLSLLSGNCFWKRGSHASKVST